MSLKHALLAMLDIDKGSGYDLMKRFDSSVGFFWPSTFQQVYRDLNNLEQKGLIEAEEIEQDGKPNKKVYHINDAGLVELQHWLAKPAKDMKIKDTFLVKLFAGRQTSRKKILADLDCQQQQHKANLKCYEELAEALKGMEPKHFKKYFLPYQTLDLGIRFEKTWLEWSLDLQETLSDADDIFSD